MSNEQIGLHQQLCCHIEGTSTDVEATVLHRLLKLFNREDSVDVIYSTQYGVPFLGLPQLVGNEELPESLCYDVLYRFFFTHTGTKLLLSFDIAKESSIKNYESVPVRFVRLCAEADSSWRWWLRLGLRILLRHQVKARRPASSGV